MIVGVPKETFPGEHRVALVPGSVAGLKKAGLDLLLESGAGVEAGYPDEAYRKRGAEIAESRAKVFERAEVIAQVRGLGANAAAGKADLSLLRSGQVVVGFMEPLTALDQAQALAKKGVTAFSMELMPRITRAQSMDALSAMATVAGYKAVLIAADTLPRMFPMLMTAAGTVAPAHVFVIGAGVAGLQAIATAKRLGAVVYGYDIRPAVAEQIKSLGAKAVKIDLEAADAEDAGGYAKQLAEAQLQRQQGALAEIAADMDVIVSTAAIPGKPSPLLLTEDAVRAMKPGSVIVDLAAERGGNCALTKADRKVMAHGVTILGPLNLESSVPYHASQMYARNVTTFLAHLVKDGALVADLEDEITAETLVAREGEVVHPRLRQLLGLADEPKGAAADAPTADKSDADDSGPDGAERASRSEA